MIGLTGMIMQDRSSGLQNMTELKFSRERGFFDKSLFIRLLIGGLMIGMLFVILHFRDIRTETLEVGTRAGSYVVAQEDFNFLDDDATAILRQQAVRDIGKIYRIEEKDLEDDSLRSLRFTDAKTLAKINEVSGPHTHFVAYPAADLEEPFILFEGKKWRIEEDIPAEEQVRKALSSLVSPKYTHVRAGSRIVDQGDLVTSRHVAMSQAMKKAMGEHKDLSHPTTIFGSLLMSVLLTLVFAAYLRVNHPHTLKSNRKLFLLVLVLSLTVGLAKMSEYLIVASQNDLIEAVRYPLFVPFAAILICSLMNPGIATFAAGFLTIVLTMTLTFDQNGFMVMNLAASIVAVLTVNSLRKRKEIFVVCGKAYLACVAVIFSIHFYDNTFWKGAIVTDMLSSGLFLLLTAILVVGLLPLFESLFGVMTDVTLMEYMDPNNDLLRRLTIEAPGTYQHSVVVGNLAEAAGLAIGANGLFCRVATLYHDIGKLAMPQYFTENQQGGADLHQLLTSKESAEVIIGHVTEGVVLARKAGLPQQFVDIIKEHHGTTLVYYFYRKALSLAANDPEAVDESDFRYLGPKPRSKESAIIMIADTFEAASRSLDEVSEASLAELANRLIREKIEDGQFDDSLLTFEELATVKHTLINTLIAFGHTRIKYPKREISPCDPALLEAEA